MRDFPKLRGLITAPMWTALCLLGLGRATGVIESGDMGAMVAVLLPAGLASLWLRGDYRRRFGTVRGSTHSVPVPWYPESEVLRDAITAGSLAVIVASFIVGPERINLTSFMVGTWTVGRAMSDSVRIERHWLFAGVVALIAAFVPLFVISPAVRFASEFGVMPGSYVVASVIDHFILVRRFDEMRALSAGVGAHA